MRLQEIMTYPVEMIEIHESAEAAWNRMQAERIHHLVVKRGPAVLGVLSARDLGSNRGAVLRSGKSVGDLMVSSVVTADANTTVREAANKLRGRGIGCLPVTDKGRLVGIVTVADLLDLIGRGATRPVATAQRRSLGRRGPRRRLAGREGEPIA